MSPAGSTRNVSALAHSPRNRAVLLNRAWARGKLKIGGASGYLDAAVPL